VVGIPSFRGRIKEYTWCTPWALFKSLNRRGLTWLVQEDSCLTETLSKDLWIDRVVASMMVATICRPFPSTKPLLSRPLGPYIDHHFPSYYQPSDDDDCRTYADRHRRSSVSVYNCRRRASADSLWSMRCRGPTACGSPYTYKVSNDYYCTISINSAKDWDFFIFREIPENLKIFETFKSGVRKNQVGQGTAELNEMVQYSQSCNM